MIIKLKNFTFEFSIKICLLKNWGTILNVYLFNLVFVTCWFLKLLIINLIFRRQEETAESGEKPRSRRFSEASEIFHETAGWRNLETSVKCLQAMVAGMNVFPFHWFFSTITEIDKLNFLFI